MLLKISETKLAGETIECFLFSMVGSKLLIVLSMFMFLDWQDEMMSQSLQGFWMEADIYLVVQERQSSLSHLLVSRDRLRLSANRAAEDVPPIINPICSVSFPSFMNPRACNHYLSANLSWADRLDARP